MDDRWYRIWPRSAGGADLHPGWLKEFKREQMCAAGRHRLREFAGVPVELHLSYCSGSHVCDFTPTSAFVVRRDLMEVFESYSADYLHWGPVYVSKLVGHDLVRATGPDPRFASLVAPYRLPMRGGPESTRQFCPACNAFMYWPLPQGYQYAVRNTLRPEQKVYLGGTGYFIVAEEVLAQLPDKLRRKMCSREILVRDEPEDGIEDFPLVWD